MKPTDSPVIRVAVIEDDSAFRESLALLIEGAEGMRCVGKYANAESALRALPAEAPDVVISDIQMPGLSGVECVARLKPQLPKTHFIMLTVFEDSEQVFDALRSGASGYLVKATPPAKILEAIQDAHKGGSPMSSHIARKVVQSFQQVPKTSSETDSLSAREREILELLAGGYRYKEIADKLQISVLTVRTHIRNIYDKLHVTSRTEAAVKFIRS